jgi:hypothetical protein
MESIWGTFTLGEFIDELKRFKATAQIRFDFCSFEPAYFDSYRGFYDHLALGYKRDYKATVGSVLKMAEDAVGDSFTGWKGGTYTMDRKTPVWVANQGDNDGTTIVGLERWMNDFGVIIHTSWRDA